MGDYKAKGLPSDETLKGELVTYKGFNPNSVGEFLKAFRETLEFAGLTNFSVLESEVVTEQETPSVKVGDYVQWVSRGVEQFRRLYKSFGFTDDGKYAFLEGEKTAAPVGELEIGEPPFVPRRLPEHRRSLYAANNVARMGAA